MSCDTDKSAKKKKKSKECFHIPHTYPDPSQVDPVRAISTSIVICEFVTVGIADFAIYNTNLKSIG